MQIKIVLTKIMEVDFDLLEHLNDLKEDRDLSSIFEITSLDTDGKLDIEKLD